MEIIRFMQMIWRDQYNSSNDDDLSTDEFGTPMVCNKYVYYIIMTEY